MSESEKKSFLHQQWLNGELPDGRIVDRGFLDLSRKIPILTMGEVTGEEAFRNKLQAINHEPSGVAPSYSTTATTTRMG